MKVDCTPNLFFWQARGYVPHARKDSFRPPVLLHASIAQPAPRSLWRGNQSVTNVPPDASRTRKGKYCAPIANRVRMSDFSRKDVGWRYPERARRALVPGTPKSSLTVRALLIALWRSRSATNHTLVYIGTLEDDCQTVPCPGGYYASR